MHKDNTKNYLHDLGVLLKERARDAKKKKDSSIKHDEKDYNLGYLMALHEVIALMKDQAEIFEIDQASIGLADIDPESELL